MVGEFRKFSTKALYCSLSTAEAREEVAKLRSGSFIDTLCRGLAYHVRKRNTERFRTALIDTACKDMMRRGFKVETSRIWAIKFDAKTRGEAMTKKFKPCRMRAKVDAC